ncbi:hypothetical protein CC80DRAFT_528311 [Byssothecium circinans]|uniref:DUF1365-domain-containing protein n=1 Tax=Byssothecium circinans TaxID=147558 RepID=A0A6A5TG92_9PLEO|nr:hypothetical protein CC80DRAFT_528311 [Byssothecium circinans]
MGTETSSRGGLLRSLCFAFLSIIPCALISGSLTWPFLLLWVVGGGVRLQCGDQGVAQDCVFFGLINVWLLRDGLREVVEKSWNVFEEGLMKERGLLTTVLIGILPLTGFGIFLSRRSRTIPLTLPQETLSEGSRQWTLEHPKLLIFPCKTTHARIFPKQHAFGYSYLLCGFPIVPAGTTADGKDFGDGKDRVLGSSWLCVRAEDYLERGNGDLGFYGKLKAFLEAHNVEDSKWSYAYLVTAPRFFGYSFNPVSFWYIYDRNHDLKKMILEVNNTFGERRMYLLDGSSPPNLRQTSDSEHSTNSQATKTRFTDIWMKDFHVSPFNSRKGSYALKALNPFPYASFSDPKIDITITLKSSKDHAKIVARVFRTGKSISPDSMNIVETLRFICSWWWVGFVTSPRIIREAFKLYTRRSLHVWFKPEVMASSISRTPIPIEETLQTIFYDYLDHLVQKSSEAFEIDYHTAIPNIPKQKIAKRESMGERNLKKLELRVTTSAFYSRFVHYAHTSEALDRECHFTDEKNRTLWISHPELLPRVFPNSRTKLQDENKPHTKRNFLDELRWTLLRKLRCPSPEPAYTVTPGSTEFDVNDIRTLPYSDLDCFVRGPRRQHAKVYRRTVTKIFLAQRFAFGNPQFVTVFDLGLRFLSCWLASKELISLAQTTGHRASRLGWISSFESASTLEPLRADGIEWWWISSLAMFVCGCHFYGFAKGYR